MENTDPELFSLLFDSGHLAYCGEDYMAVLKKYAKRIKHVHLKDIRPQVIEKVKAEHLSFLQGVRLGTFTVPGDGAIDFGPIFDVLAENDYEGYVLVEANLQGEIAHTLRFMPNVLGFLGGLDNPTPVRQADINRILGTAEETIIRSEEMASPYNVDDAVKVTDGPFNGFSGIIEEVNAEKRKLKVMVKIFGRKTPLELGFNQVEKE